MTDEHDVAIRISQIRVQYGDSVVIPDLSADILSNRWTALLGRNGAGKSTLIRAIVGVGEGSDAVRFPGRTEPRAAFCAYVPQAPVLPPGMTVAEYVLLGRTAHLGWFGSEGPSDRNRAAEALELLDLASFAGRFVTELSGGEAQRAVLARALCQDAKILILDEPTSNLDIGHQLEVMELVGSLIRREGLTVVSAVHDLTAAARHTDDALLLDQGALVAVGSADDVLVPDLLSKHYQTPMHRMVGPDGHPVIIPLRAPDGSHTRP